MISGRRARKRSLIRSDVIPAIMVRPLSSKDGTPNPQAGPSDLSHTTPLSSYAMSAPHQELTVYLRQLTTLHTAGILTDDEFSAAQGRLLGS